MVRSRKTGPPATAPAPSERGAALLIVLLTVAVLTALTVDLAYNTRVSLEIAAHARDELKATYMAKGAVNVARLVLHFQRKLDSAGAIGSQALSQLGLGGQTGAAGGGSSFSFRLWEVIPVDSTTVGALLGHRPAAADSKGGAKGAPAPKEPSFDAKIDDEDRKVNVAQLAGLSTVAAPQLQRFLLAVREPRYDVLFDREDENGNRFTRRDLAVNLKDWVDEDSTTSTIGLNPAAPFENGFGDENYIYERLDDRYKAKNAPYDSQDELYLVAGVSDAFMAAFGDKLTVYPDVGAKINVNSTDPAQLMLNAVLMSDPPGVPQPALADPAFLTKLGAALALVRPLPFMSITPQQFANVLVSLGVKVDPLYQQALNSDSRSPFGNTSSTFSIHAVGTAGGVQKKIEAVVTFDRRAEALSQDLGRLLHWHEE